MVNVSTLSFARAMHNEATKPRSMTACVGAREGKEPSAPGEVPVQTLSDGGSTPPTSTTRVLNKPYFFKNGFAIMVSL